jgi:hypothetical protein
VACERLRQVPLLCGGRCRGSSLQFARIGRDDGRERAEAPEQSAGQDNGDSGNASECRLGCRNADFSLRTLRVRRSIPRVMALAALGKSIQPQRGIASIRRSHDGNPKIGHSETSTADRFGRQRSVIEIAALNEQVRNSRELPKLSDLRPESSGNDRRMHSPHGLSFHDCAVSNCVIAGPQRLDLDAHSRLREKARNSTRPLMHVRQDAHEQTLAYAACSSNHKPVPTHHLLALSRSEIA